MAVSSARSPTMYGKALDGKGKVIVGDAPQSDSSFDAIARMLGLDAIREFSMGPTI